MSKPLKTIYEKAGVPTKEHIYELKGDEVYGKQIGESIDASIFATGEVCDVIGHNKGHGYSGTIKKYHHHIGPKGHGSGYHRQIGSLANNGRDNNRVIPGKKMSGHWGPEQVTIQNVTIIESNAEKGYILVKGGVPGPKKSIVMLRSPVKVQFRKPEVKELVVINQEAPKADAAEEKKGE